MASIGKRNSFPCMFPSETNQEFSVSMSDEEGRDGTGTSSREVKHLVTTDPCNKAYLPPMRERDLILNYPGDSRIKTQLTCIVPSYSAAQKQLRKNNLKITSPSPAQQISSLKYPVMEETVTGINNESSPTNPLSFSNHKNYLQSSSSEMSNTKCMLLKRFKGERCIRDRKMNNSIVKVNADSKMNPSAIDQTRLSGYKDAFRGELIDSKKFKHGIRDKKVSIVVNNSKCFAELPLPNTDDQEKIAYDDPVSFGKDRYELCARNPKIKSSDKSVFSFSKLNFKLLSLSLMMFVVLNICVTSSDAQVMPCPFNSMCKCRYESPDDDSPRTRIPAPIEVVCVGVPFAKFPGKCHFLILKNLTLPLHLPIPFLKEIFLNAAVCS